MFENLFVASSTFAEYDPNHVDTRIFYSHSICLPSHGDVLDVS